MSIQIICYNDKKEETDLTYDICVYIYRCKFINHRSCGLCATSIDRLVTPASYRSRNANAYMIGSSVICTLLICSLASVVTMPNCPLKKTIQKV